MADKKVVDVTGPEDAKIDIGSKPMIVGHKSMASDPMMREKQLDAETPATLEKPETPSQEVEAVKEDTTSKPEEIEPPSVKQKNIEPISEVLVPEQKAAEPEPEQVKTEESEKSDKANAELDATALELEKEENLRKIIDSKKYHVSIKQARNSNKSWVYVLIGLVISTIIALFILIDIGKLDAGFKLPFSIFGNDTSSSTKSSPTEDPVITETEEVDSVEETPALETSKTNITEVDLLLKKLGDESLLPEVASDSFVEYMKEKLSVFECESETGGITVSKVSSEFVSGGGGCEGGFYAAFWYKIDGEWQELGAQDTIPCTKVVETAIPIEFIDGCFDETTGTTIANPNGSIAD